LIQPGWDILIIARNSMTKAEYSEVDDAMSQLLRRADLLQALDS
jgi:ribonuclease P protein component